MEENSTDLLIIYTTKNGRTGGMVEPIQQGIIDGGGTVATRTVDEVQWEEMVSAKGIIVGTPVRFGGVDWQIKRLFDVTAYQDYPGPLDGKVGGAFVGGGTPGSGAELCLLSMLHILLNHGMVIQGHARSTHYGPVALRETAQEDVDTVCNAWGRHWAALVQRLYGLG
ncbi:MAG: hypothetical protein BZY81_05325 [SAR202 cluster bacterium Io17-Chloro-G4]|nr:MAG: hypothetical protein BZY81_05325 [SAR202 cluster bacterium Io17-Chloro-G4]